MENNDLFKIISQDIPGPQVNYCYVFSAIVEGIRNCIFMLSNDGESYCLPTDIRAAIYYSKRQLYQISQYFDKVMRDYFITHDGDEDTITLITRQMIGAGEITKLANGSCALSPYRLIDIGNPDKYILQGGITASAWLKNKSFSFNGVTRLVDNEQFKDKPFARAYDLQGWLHIPYVGNSLLKWLQERLEGLEYKNTGVDTPMEVFDVLAYKILHLKKWTGLDEIIKKKAYTYTVGRTKGIDGYSFWVLKNVGSGKYESIAKLDKDLVLRFLFALEVLYKADSRAYFKIDNDIVYLHLPNSLPCEEMKMIHALAYPWPRISKRNYKWMIVKDVWEVIKGVLGQLNIKLLEVENMNVINS